MLQNKTQLSIYVVAGLLVADFVWFGYLPGTQRLAVLRQSQAQQGAVIEQSEVAMSELPDLKAQAKSFRRQVEAFYVKVPDHRDLGAFLGQAADLMRRHGLADQAVVPGEERPGDSVTAIPLTLAATGAQGDVLGFIADLQVLPRKVRVDRIRLVHDGAHPDRVKMEAEVSIFYRSLTLEAADNP